MPMIIEVSPKMTRIALRASRGEIKGAAKYLSISEQTLRRRIKVYGIKL